MNINRKYAVDNKTLELLIRFYEKGYYQGKLDEQEGVYIDKSQLARVVEEDLTREMLISAHNSDQLCIND